MKNANKAVLALRTNLPAIREIQRIAKLIQEKAGKDASASKTAYFVKDENLQLNEVTYDGKVIGLDSITFDKFVDVCEQLGMPMRFGPL